MDVKSNVYIGEMLQFGVKAKDDSGLIQSKAGVKANIAHAGNIMQILSNSTKDALFKQFGSGRKRKTYN